MAKEVITVPDAPDLPLSPGIRAGDFIFVSGQVGFTDSAGKEVRGIEAQTRQCLENIKQVLSAAGSSMDDVVKITVFLKNANDFNQMNEVYRSYFLKEYPTRLTTVTTPVIPNMLVEIECIAYSPKSVGNLTT